MHHRQTLTNTLYQEVKEALQKRMSETRRDLKADFKVKAKYLSEEEQKVIIDKMLESYLKPYQSDTIFPELKKLSKTTFNNFLKHYSDEELASRIEDPARRRDLINQIVKYFHFAEMHEFFNKLKTDLGKDHEQAAADTKNQILSKNQVQRSKDDKFTSLSAKQTGLLLKMLQEYQVFLGEGYLTKEDMYRIAQVTTGYGRDLVKKGYNKQEIADTDRIAVAKVLKNMANELFKGTS